MRNKKTIQVTLTLVTTQSNFEAAQLVQLALEKSALNNSEFCLDVLETKVTKSEELDDNTSFISCYS